MAHSYLSVPGYSLAPRGIKVNVSEEQTEPTARVSSVTTQVTRAAQLSALGAGAHRQRRPSQQAVATSARVAECVHTSALHRAICHACQALQGNGPQALITSSPGGCLARNHPALLDCGLYPLS